MRSSAAFLGHTVLSESVNPLDHAMVDGFNQMRCRQRMAWIENGMPVYREEHPGGEKAAPGAGALPRGCGDCVAGRVPTRVDSTTLKTADFEKYKVCATGLPDIRISLNSKRKSRRRSRTAATSALPRFNPANNQINTSGFSYDPAGDLTGGGTNTYQYDGEQRAVGVNNGATVSYTYNALGLRVASVWSGGTGDFLYGPNGRWLGVAGSVSPVYLGSRLLAFADRMGESMFPHVNPLGSITMETYYNGAVGTDVLFYPWGDLWTNAGLVDYQFAGTIWSDGPASADYATYRLYPGLGGGIGECPFFACVPNCSIFACGPLPGGPAGGGGGGSAPAPKPKPAPPSTGFTLGLRLPNQTFNQCMSQNANTYSIGGSLELLKNYATGTNTSYMSTPIAKFFTGNAVSGFPFGSGGDASSALSNNAPSGLSYFMGAPLTYGRRTTDIMPLNLEGIRGGPPQVLSQASSGVQDFLGEIGDVFSLGMSFTTRLGIDAALGGAEAIGCAIPQ